MRIFVLIITVWAMNAQAQSLKALLTAAFAETLPPQAQIEIRRSGGPEKVGGSPRVQWFRPRPPVGAVGYAASWVKNGKTVEWRGTADVVVRAPVVIASQTLRNGQRFEKAALKMEMRELQPHLGTGYFTNLDEVLGQEVRGWVRPGRVVGTTHVAPPTLVRSGQEVALERVNGNLSVMARVQALQNGRLGEWIRVRNPHSRKTLRVRVAALGKVQLN